jgi:rhodanese-related sulfurtransferase
MTNFRDLLSKVKSEIKEVTPEDVDERLRRGDKFLILDVREDEEVEHGILPGARHVTRGHLESRVEDVLTDKDAEVVVYCAGGVRSAFATKTLEELGYSNVSSMSGGFTRWKDLGFEYAMPRMLDASQRDRYSRHLVLPEVGEQGQIKFLESKVLSIGAGGLSSPALLYLAAAGVGTIGIVDADVVEASNLQRQIVHSTDTIGMSKAESAREAITKLNHDVKVEVHPFRIDESNAKELIGQYDLVVDGCDNFEAPPPELAPT